jgi:hypothetical protein
VGVGPQNETSIHVLIVYDKLSKAGQPPTTKWWEHRRDRGGDSTVHDWDKIKQRRAQPDSVDPVVSTMKIRNPLQCFYFKSCEEVVASDLSLLVNLCGVANECWVKLLNGKVRLSIFYS